MYRKNGFTLIELMIVVTIIAILSSIAIPMYTDYIRRTRISEAVSRMSEAGIRMEQFFQDRRTYAGSCATGTVAPPIQATARFTFACSGQSATGYTITATGNGNMAGFTYTMTQGNGRATTAVPSGWTTSTTCWVLKKDGSCA